MNLLCGASSFFKAAFTSQFRESFEKKMDLPEEEEDVFELFVQWLYHRRYEVPLDGAEGLGSRYLGPVRLYVLADRYDVGELRTFLVTKLFAMAKRSGGQVPSCRAVAYVYDHTSQTSGLRRLVVDWWAYRVQLSWFSSEFGQNWLQEHPEVAAAVISIFAMSISRATQINPFEGEMPERYKEDIREAQN